LKRRTVRAPDWALSDNRRATLKKRIDDADPADLRVCSVVKAEMYFGAARSNNPVRALEQQKYFLDRFVSLVFDDAAAEVYGSTRGELAKLGTPIGPNDLMIASIAVAHSVVLVTNNTGEFGRVRNLVVEDWELPPAP